MIDTISPLWLLAIAAYLSVAWAAVFHRLWGRRRYNLASVDYWSSCGGFLALALMITLPLPPVMVEFDRLAGLAGLADALADTAALATILAWLVYLSRLVPPDRRWIGGKERGAWIPWRALDLLVAVTIAGFAGRFFLAPGLLGFRLGPHPDFARSYLTATHLLYRASCLVLLILVIIVLRRLTPVVGEHAALATRLWVIRAILWYMLLYIVYEAISAVVLWLPDLSSRIFRLRSLLLLAAIVIPSRWYLAGLTLFSRLAAPFQGLLNGWRNWRGYHALYPLWAALYPVRPDGSHLESPSRIGAWWPGRPLDVMLCRIVAEIHDRSIDLWPEQSPRAATIAEGIADEAALPGERRVSLVMAVILADALANRAVPAPPAARSAGFQLRHRLGGGTTLWEEVAALRTVARAFAHSPLVAEALVRLGHDTHSPHGPRTGGTQQEADQAAMHAVK